LYIFSNIFKIILDLIYLIGDEVIFYQRQTEIEFIKNIYNK